MNIAINLTHFYLKNNNVNKGVYQNKSRSFYAFL